MCEQMGTIGREWLHVIVWSRDERRTTMPAIEFPRGGRANGGIDNAGESHLPCVVLADTSLSMSDAVADLNKGLVEMGEQIKENNEARGKVEICVIQFDDSARIVKAFGSMYDYKAPVLDAGGTTHMHEAVDAAINEIQIRRKQYKELGVSSLKPWIFLMTDGAPTDTNNGAFDRLAKLQEEDGWNYFPVAVGNHADVDFLKRNNAKGFVLTAGKDRFDSVFEFLSDSLSMVSVGNPGSTESVRPTDYEGIQINI